MEEFGVELTYLKGSHNVAADALSRLPRTCKATDTTPTEAEECLNINSLPTDAFPLRYDNIREEQQNDKNLKKRVDDVIFVCSKTQRHRDAPLHGVR